MTTFKYLFLAGVLASAIVSGVRADEADTFNVYLALGAQRDSNLFRQSANGRSDTIATTSLTLALNKPMGLQRFSLQATLVDYRYAEFDYLDYRALNYSGVWNWALTHRLSGDLTLNQTEAQNSFVDFVGGAAQTRPNVRKTRVNHFGAEWRVAGGWRLLGGVTNNEQANSDTFNAENGFVLNSGELGGKYQWSAGTYLQVLQREGHGEYTDRVLVGFDVLPASRNPQFDTEFKQSETEAKFYVPLTGKSSVSTRLARQSRKHEHFPQRDYDANIGRVDLNWQPLGKISLTGSLRREISAYQDNFSSYYLADGFNLQPYWQISGKVGMRLRYDWQRRKYDGELFPSRFSERRDTLQTVALGVDWQPVRWLTLSGNVQRDSRKSSRDNFDFEANILSLNANFSF